ncbi:MAG: chorismate-binding protein, partial [Dehalococcoidales bacterium]|nr:chorismate-binding protein [Dehalococcoidales bacterium]
MKRFPLIEEIIPSLTAPQSFELFRGQPLSFFLDSGMAPARLGRYSFMGSDPFLVLKSWGEEITLIRDGKKESRRGNPFDVAGELLACYSLDECPTGIPFTGGVVGYFSYDLCHFIEHLPAMAIDDLDLPECYLAFYDAVVVFDHWKGSTYLVASGFPEQDEVKRKRRAQEGLIKLKNRIAKKQVITEEAVLIPAAEDLALRSNFSHREYLKAVATAREYICAGDIFQVNLSQRFETSLNIPSYELYRRLRRINPAPFASYLNFDGVSVVGASPERFLKVRGDRVETRPIKGTRPRGKSPE